MEWDEKRKIAIENRKKLFNHILLELKKDLSVPDNLVNPIYYNKNPILVENNSDTGSLFIGYKFGAFPTVYGKTFEYQHSLFITGDVVRIGTFLQFGEWFFEANKELQEKILDVWTTGSKQLWFGKEPAPLDVRSENQSILLEWVFDFSNSPKSFYDDYGLQEMFLLNMRHYHFQMCDRAFLYTTLIKDLSLDL